MNIKYGKNTTHYQKETCSTIIYKKKKIYIMTALDRYKAAKHDSLFLTYTITDKTLSIMYFYTLKPIWLHLTPIRVYKQLKLTQYLKS